MEEIKESEAANDVSDGFVKPKRRRKESNIDSVEEPKTGPMLKAFMPTYQGNRIAKIKIGGIPLEIIPERLVAASIE